MKKVILFLAVIVAAMFVSYSLNENKFQKIIKRDNAFIAAYYFDHPKDTKLRPYAIKSALKLIDERNDTSAKNVYRNIAYKVLERCWSTDSLAKFFYEKNRSSYDHLNTPQQVASWNAKTDKLLSILSDDSRMAIKEVVLKGEAPDDFVDGSWTKIESKEPVIHDLLWAQKYLPREEIEKICLSHVSYRTQFFLRRTPDSILVKNITEKLPDSLVVMYKFGEKVSPARQWKIAKNLPLKEAIDFLWDCGREEKCAAIFALKKSEAEKDKLFEYYHYGCYSKGYLFSRLANLNVSQLTKIYDSWGNSELFHEYAILLIKSVRNKSDYLLAISFFKESGAYEELEILRNQARFRI